MEEFNAKFATVPEGGKTHVFEQRRDPELNCFRLDKWSFKAFRERYSHLRLSVPGSDGEPITKTFAEWWLSNPKRRHYDRGAIFDPSGNTPEGYLNLWRGYGVDPAAGDWSLLREHIERVVCRGEPKHFDYFLNWAALMVQHPNKPGEVAIVLRGKKGTGKGIVGTSIATIFGPHALQISNSSHLVGRFNSHLRACVFLFADEAFFAGDKPGEGTLKSLITERRLAIEEKFEAVKSEANRLHIMLASNSEWVIPATADERRFFCLEVADNRRGDFRYFRAIRRQLDNGGLAAMLYELLHRDISKFDVRDLPASPALAWQKTFSLDSVAKWWLTVLTRGFLFRSRHGDPRLMQWCEPQEPEPGREPKEPEPWEKGFFTNNLLHDSYLQWLSENRPYDRKSREELGRFMIQLYPRKRPYGPQILSELESPDAHRGSVVFSPSNKRCPGYQVGSLDEARASFCEKFDGVIVEWREEEDDPGG